MQTLSNLRLLLLSTFTPAGREKLIAEITSDNPKIPKDNLLPVISYNRQPNKTGVIRKPAMNNMRAMANRVNSLFMMREPRYS